jgi:hypothetical protein
MKGRIVPVSNGDAAVVVIIAFLARIFRGKAENVAT